MPTPRKEAVMTSSTHHRSGEVHGTTTSDAPGLVYRAIDAEDAEAAEEGVRVAQRAVNALADDDLAAFLAAVDELGGCGAGYTASALMYTLREALGPMVKADRTWFARRLLEAVEGFKVVQVDEADDGSAS